MRLGMSKGINQQRFTTNGGADGGAQLGSVRQHIKDLISAGNHYH